MYASAIVGDSAADPVLKEWVQTAWGRTGSVLKEWAETAWANPAGRFFSINATMQVCEREPCFRLVVVEEATRHIPYCTCTLYMASVCSGYDRL